MEENNYTVYMHINKINGKMYIGITKQIPEKRWRDGKGYKSQTYFYNAINKYGWDNFEHELIATKLTEKEAKNFEILLIKLLETTNQNKGYNITNGGEGSNGYIASQETRIKQSKARKGLLNGKNNPMYGVSPKNRMDKETYDNWLINHSKKGSDNANSKSVICITTGEIFDYIKRASSKYNIQDTDITTCCKGKLKSAGKHPITNQPMQWQYYEDYLNGIDVGEYNNSRIKKIICITTNEIFNSTKEASLKYNVHSSNITLCCQGKYKKAGKNPIDNKPLIWEYYVA